MIEHKVRANDGVYTFVTDWPAIGEETGPPVVCLHGLTRNHKDFRDIIVPLQQMGRRVVALDVRGRGKSDRDPNPTNYNPFVYVQDLMAVMSELTVTRAVFIGTSMGGLMTMILASFAPHMIAGAVLNDIGPEIDPVGLKRIQGYVGVAMPQIRNWDEAGARLGVMGATMFPNKDHAFWIDFAQRNCIETPEGIIFDYDPAIAQIAGTPTEGPLPTMWEQFAAFKDIPTAVIRGALSDLLSADIVSRMKQVKPDLITAEVPHVGHAPMLAEAEAWKAIVAVIRLTK